VLNKHFQVVLSISKLQSTGLQVCYFGGGYFFFSPIAAEVLKRRGYKVAILMGLALYSLGAVMFWPTAHFTSAGTATASFGGFCACTFVIACGLATLETAANSYAVVIGSPQSASARLQFCQSWNGVASFIGPLIASKFFFTGENANNLTNVQFVYLAVACAGVAVAVLFALTKLPEVAEAAVRRTDSISTVGFEAQKPLWREYNMMGGFVAQFCYVGAQVTIASFFINYVTENGGFESATASNMLSYALIVFTVGRFVATGLATVLSAGLIMTVYVAAAIALNAYVCAGTGSAASAVLILLFFFEAPMYPILFTLGTANLGRNTRRGAGILVMGVSGGAVFPPIQGAIADAANTRISYVVPLVGFVVVGVYVVIHWIGTGFEIRRTRTAQVVAASRQASVVEYANVDEKDMGMLPQKEVVRV